MDYVTYLDAYTDDADLHLPRSGPALRAIGRGLTVLGGGVLFAATIYVMIVLPGLF